MIWSGLGFLVVVIVYVSSFISELITREVTGDLDYYQNNHTPFYISIFVSCSIIYFLGQWLNTRKAKTYIDKATGEEIVFKNNHSFFFIRMEYWGIIICIVVTALIIKEQLF